VKQADAWPGGIDNVAMTRTDCRDVRQRGCTIVCWRATETAMERTREDFVTREPGGDRNCEHPVATRSEPRCRALESKAQHVLLRSLPDETAEGAVKMKPRPSRTRSQLLERQVVVQAATHFAQQL
jgi:hypothetical protein